MKESQRGCESGVSAKRQVAVGKVSQWLHHVFHNFINMSELHTSLNLE